MNYMIIYEIIAGILIVVAILIHFNIMKNKVAAIKSQTIYESNRLKEEAKKKLNPKKKKLYWKLKKKFIN